jgi:hypothetical protein
MNLPAARRLSGDEVFTESSRVPARTGFFSLVGVGQRWRWRSPWSSVRWLWQEGEESLHADWGERKKEVVWIACDACSV